MAEPRQTGPRPMTPRVDDVAPSDFARLVGEATKRFLSAPLEQSSSRVHERLIGHARFIAEFAQTGAGHVGAREAEALDCLEQLLFTRIVDEPVNGARPLRKAWEYGDESSIAGLMCAAARARMLLAEGKPVTARELAAVGRCSSANVRMALRSGVLSRTSKKSFIGNRRTADAPILAAGAIRWLAGRGIPGFETEVDHAGKRIGGAPPG